LCGASAQAQSEVGGKIKRIRIARESEASHDLIQLLDKPISLYKQLSFFGHEANPLRQNEVPDMRW